MPSRDRSLDGRSSASSSSTRSASPDEAAALKRKRPISRSPSAASTASSRSASRSRSPPPRSRRRKSSRGRSPSFSSDEDANRRDESSRAAAAQQSEAKAKDVAAKGEALRSTLAKLSATKAGGAYIPPARLKALMAEAAAADPGSIEFQRMSWDALKKSITGLVNKVASENIKTIVVELFGGSNLIRGRGLYCRSIMRAQALSLSFTPVFAALTAVVNTKLPMVGELLVIRLVSQFRRSFKRNDKTVCNSTAMFIAHLVNQRVVHEVLALEILVLLLEKPTDDSVEIAVGFMREVGAFLAEEAPKANNSIFDRFRAVLYEGDISKRVQYMIEVLSQVRRDGFKDNPRIPEALDLVEEDDQITHSVSLDDQLNVQEGLNVFKNDPDFLENEERYRAIKAEILGEEDDSDDNGSDADSETGSSSDESEAADPDAAQRQLEIHDRTETNLTNLRRTIYLTIMSSLDFEESVHKLLKLEIPEGQDIELCNMIVECCSQERTYSKFYGNMGERFCRLHRKWSDNFEQSFRNYYDTIHRYETNRLRNIARFFGHLYSTDSVSWAALSVIHMNEEDTTSSSRIFVKILFQEIQQQLSLKTLAERFREPSLQEHWQGLFPKDNPKNTRFSINYFTSIGMGVLTEDMREHLKNAPKILLAQRQAALAARGSDDSDTDSSSVLSSSTGSRSRRSYSSRSPRSYSSRSRSSRSRSRSYSSGSYSSRSYSSRSYSSYSGSSRSRSRSRSRDGSRRPRGRSISRSLSRSFTRSPSRSRSRTPSPRRRRGRSRTRSASYSSYSSRSRSYSRSRSRSYSRSFSRSRSYSRSLSRSRSRSRSVHAPRDRRYRSASRSERSYSDAEDRDRGSRPLSRTRRDSFSSQSRSPSPRDRR